MTVVQEEADPLHRCGLCGMQMPAVRITKHPQNHRCDKNTHMRWQIEDVAISNKYTEVTFNLMGEDGGENVEGVDVFKYLVRPLDRPDGNWM